MHTITGSLLNTLILFPGPVRTRQTLAYPTRDRAIGSLRTAFHLTFRGSPLHAVRFAYIPSTTTI